MAPLKDFGPTVLQEGLPDPPEKCATDIDEDMSDRLSVTTLQHILGKRDAQTTELHKQLKVARQNLWDQTLEARTATARLHDFLADPARAPEAQAEAMQRMQLKIRELSGRMAESRLQEQNWCAVAKRQHVFMMQCERMMQEGSTILVRNMTMDDGDNPGGSVWDVGRSHCNPYSVDSWPFEPNALAQRASQEPNLNRWDEGDDDVLEDEDDGEDHVLHRWGSDDRGRSDTQDEDDEGADEDGGGRAKSWTRAAMQRGMPPPPNAATGEGSETSRSL